MKRLLSALFVALLMAAPAAAETVPPIHYETRTLANGLKVFTVLDRSTPNVTVQMWYGVGAKDDPPGRSGFAHLFEHLMFKSTKDMPAEFMDRLTEDVGGFNNASTWDDLTEYHEVIPANHLQQLLWAESERLGSLVVDQANFKSERDVVKEELRMRVLADPYGRLQNWDIPAASFTVHPYKRSAIGSIADLNAATLDDVRAFHAAYYRPDNAALIVVGNFDEAQLQAWVDQYFGPIPTPKTPVPRVTVKEPPRTGPRTVTDYGPDVPLPAVAITWLAPDAASDDGAPLTVLDAILSGGESSRLFESMVHDQQVAQSVFSNADLRQQPGLFMVGAVLASGKTPEQGEAALRAEVAKLREQPVSEAELDKAKISLIADAVRQRETIQDRASSLGQALILQGDASRANSDIARLEAVTAADVQRVARQYLADNRRVVVRYLSDDQRPKGAPAEEEATPPSPPVVAAAPLPAAPPSPQLAPPDQRQPPPPVGPPVAAELPAPVERTLANGLRVIVARSSSLPLVSARLTLKSGAAGDPAGKAGLADLTASLLTQGAGGKSATQFAAAIEGLGAQVDASAGWDGVSVSVNALDDKIAPAMALMADAVRRPAFEPAEIDRLRARTLDGLQVALKDPGDVARYATAVALFGGGPYGHVLGGTPQSLPKITRADIVALHEDVYRPDNAVLVLTGDITPEAGFALAEKTFGDWSEPSISLPAISPAKSPPHPRAILIDMPGAGQAAVSVALPGIARSDVRFYPGIVANAVLGGGYSARLNQEVRIKRGLSYGASSVLDARRLPGPFVAGAQTKNESAVQVVNLILAEIGREQTQPVDAAELTARKAVLTGSFGRTVATADGLAGYLSNLALQGVPLDEIRAYTTRVDQVDPTSVKIFAGSVFDPADATVVVVGDGKIIAPALKARFPNLEIIPAADLKLDSPTLK